MISYFPNGGDFPANSSTPIAFANFKCNTVELHILRCSYDISIPSNCDHNDDVMLECSDSLLWESPYDTQVRLHSTNSMGSSPSSGTLEIYVTSDTVNAWGNVCSHDFPKTSADSACRQLGYTGASDYSTNSRLSTNITWLDHVSCKNRVHSCNCLNSCFEEMPDKPIFCSNNAEFVEIVCTYDVSIQDDATSGGFSECDATFGVVPCKWGSSNYNSIVIVITVVVVIVVVLLIFLILSFVVCYGIARWKRHGYDSINRD